MDLMQMWQAMGFVAKAVAFILFFMSMWSFGVAIERIFTYTQARNQSKLYAPQVAKHLKEGRLKDAIALSASKNYRYSHLAKVVLHPVLVHVLQHHRVLAEHARHQLRLSRKKSHAPLP